MASISANGSKGHHRFTLEVTQSATNIANNTSTLSFNFKLSPTDNGGWDFYEWGQLIAYTITINGTNYTGYIPDYNGTSVVTLKSGTQSVGHNADGSKSISYSFSVTDYTGMNYTTGNASASGTFKLNDIPRASTISAVSGTTIGGTMTVTIARAVSTFTHQLWYKVGNSAWYDLGKGIGTSKAFTIDIATANQFPNATTGNLQLCVRTFSGSTTIGEDYYKDVTVSVPTYTPTISAIKLTGNNLLSGEYVKGKSTVTAEITATTLYGASIKSIVATVDGKTYSGSKITSAALSNGTKTVSVTVTDTRGKTATLASSAITVRDYANPTITEFTLVRQSDGTTVIATVKGSVAAVNNKNAKTIEVTLNGVTQTITSSSYTINGTTTFTNVPTDNTLTSVAKITDSYTHATREFVLPTVAVTMDFHHSGTGIAMGKVAELPNTLDVAWKIKNNSIPTLLGGLGEFITNNSNLNTEKYLIPGNYLCSSNDSAKTLLNSPSSIAFKMCVYNCLDIVTDTYTAEWMYVVREITNIDGKKWTQFVRKEGGDWNFGNWCQILDSSICADYLIDQGNLGVWRYCAWNSGFAECWGYHTISGVNISTAWGSWYASPVITLPSFPFTFVGSPDVHVSWESDFSAIIDGVQKRESTKAGQVYLYRPVAQTNVNGRFSIYAYGRWK